MPANAIIKQVTLGAAYAALSSTDSYGDFQLWAPVTNGNNAFIEGDEGADVLLDPGVPVMLLGVNLAEIKVKGTSPDVVTVIGASRT